LHGFLFRNVAITRFPAIAGEAAAQRPVVRRHERRPVCALIAHITPELLSK
jgi:hypothetical protein